MSASCLATRLHLTAARSTEILPPEGSMKTKRGELADESGPDDPKTTLLQRVKRLRQTLGLNRGPKPHRDDWGERSFNDKGFTER